MLAGFYELSQDPEVQMGLAWSCKCKLLVEGGCGRGLVSVGSSRKAKETWLLPCCCAIFAQGNNRNYTVNKNRQVKNFPRLSLLISFLVRNYPTPEKQILLVCSLETGTITLEGKEEITELSRG